MARRQHIYVPWREGMTVENLLASASRLPKGVQFAQQGSGESALLTEINGTANEGGNGRNWTYSVNGTRGRPQLRHLQIAAKRPRLVDVQHKAVKWGICIRVARP